MDVQLVVESGAALDVRSIVGKERLGETNRFDLELFSTSPPAVKDLVGKGCVIVVRSQHEERAIPGTITRASVMATAHAEEGRIFRVRVESLTHALGLRRRSKTFQKKTVPTIVKEVLVGAGVPDTQIDVTHPTTPERRWIVQYDETDYAFVRRLCEEEGLYFRFELRDGKECFVLEDNSANAADVPGGALTLIDEANLHPTGLTAFESTERRVYSPGKIHVRNYDHEHPAVQLKADKSAGEPTEQACEVYWAPPPRTAPGEESTRAQKLLEALRHEAHTIGLSTNHVAISPGHAFEIDVDAGYEGVSRPEGKFVALQVSHRWHDGERYHLEVEALPKATPFRLPVETPRPYSPGIHSAFVTGPQGEEIHVDPLGRTTLHFHWDREGKDDHDSSPAFRVMQANTPGSLIHPRVGWEVVTAFEDGDPERPVVLGRTYNGKFGAPVSLPGNKTMTSFSSASSPGGAVRTGVTFDDAAGRQHLAMACFNFLQQVANDHVKNVGNKESLKVIGDSSHSVGANASLAVTSSIAHSADGLFTTNVGAMHKTVIAGTQFMRVGPYGVEVGGALIEKVGSATEGFKALGRAALLELPGLVGGFLGGYAGAVGAVLGKVFGGLGGALGFANTIDTMAFKGAHATAVYSALGIAPGAGETQSSTPYTAPTDAWHKQASIASAQSGAIGGVNSALGLVGKELPPGISAASSAISGVSGAVSQGVGMLDDAHEMDAVPDGPEAGGGATVTAGQGGGPITGGPGIRSAGVMGGMLEKIGPKYVVASPGPISASTTGWSRTTIGGSLKIMTALGYGHTARALLKIKVSGSQSIRTATTIDRASKGAITMRSYGDLKVRGRLSGYIIGDGGANVQSSSVTTLKGAEVNFVCGDSTITVCGDGVSMKASDIEINGKSIIDDTANHT